jgi:hypothetical protein
MAIDPRLSLAVQGPRDIGQVFSNALLNAQGVQNIRQAPLRNELLQAQVGTAQAERTQQEQLNRFTSVARGATEILPDLRTGNFEGVLQKLQARRAQLISDRLPTETTDDSIRLLSTDPQKLLANANQVVQIAQQQGVLKAPIRGVPGTASERDFQTFQALQARAQAPDATQEEITAANQFGRQAGFFRESAQELADIAVKKAEDIAAGEAGVELETAPTIEASKAAAKAAIARSEKAFDQIGKIKTNVTNLDEVVRLIDEGAATGVIASRLPSVRATSIQLDNLQGRLGLDVIGETTFGALSESELAFALSTALPKSLAGPDLRRWALRKKEAQLKLAGYLEEVATFLGTPGNTTADFIELQKVRRLEEEEAATQPAAQPDAAPQGGVSTLSDEDLFNF